MPWPPVEKEGEETEAYQNLQEVRKRIRLLHEATQTSASNKEYETHKRVVNEYVRKQPMLQQAIERERAVAAAFLGNGSLNPLQREYLEEAYELIQKVPTFPAAPEGEIENKLRAIEALVKAKGGDYVLASPVGQKLALLNSIVSILHPEATLHLAEEAAEQEEKKEKENTLIEAKIKVLTMVPSKWNLNAVTNQDAPGKKMPLHKIPDTAPITWGTCTTWMDKKNTSWDKKPPVIYVHPAWFALWKETKFTPLHATMPTTVF